MSIVDTWDWDKLNPEELEESLETDVHEKIHLMMYDFANRFGIYPNRINMGRKLVDEILNYLYYSYTNTRTLEEVAEERKTGIIGQYEGIPVKLDHDNPDILEVGYMVKWIESKE